jgi:aryl-alcohol dehydrogenase-like predicted oxidoreductase
VGDDVSSDSLVISVAHLRENLAAEHITLDDQALRDLDRVSA